MHNVELVFQTVLSWIGLALTSIGWGFVGTAVATLLGVYFATYLREKRTAKSGHYHILKKEVIEPIA